VSAKVDAILKLEVPVIVLLGERQMPVAEVVKLSPGAIIELPKPADDELELLVNNKAIGVGRAVKVGENFGIRITFIGDQRQRVLALGSAAAEAEATKAAEAAAEAMLAGQV
jgi:flagellar motor switch protein FliN/FliY